MKHLEGKRNAKDETLGFIIKMNDKSPKQQGLLAALSNIYDPLGLGAAVLLKGRQIIQTIYKQNSRWHNPIDDEIAQEWVKLRNNLITLQHKSLPRCMKPKDFGKIANCTLHHFSDAYQSGYGQCSYIKLVNDTAQIHCSLLIGKSRDTPLKFISIPRLELTAAALSVKISKILREELDVHVDDEIFWTDGQVVLG